MISSDSRPDSKTPAWKKLGLKLKQSDASPSANDTPAVGHPDRSQEGPNGKRKFGAQSASDYSHGNKKSRTGRFDSSPYSNGTPQLKKKKSVTFGETPTKKDALTRAPLVKATPTPKKPKGPAKKPKPAPVVDTQPALEYLRLWKTSPEAWKFNKNHQSTLIKAVFESGVPAADIDAFYDYIQPLKGFVRQRLRETAMEIRTKDASDGATAFPTDTPDTESKQATYETILSNWLESLRVGQKRPFSEVDYVTSAQDEQIVITRVVKRMRAEMVLTTLNDGYETDASTNTVGSARAKAANSEAVKDTTRTQVNGVPGKRRRKLRINDGDDSSSSSESDSDSDSDTSSSGSSSSSSSDSDSDDDDDEQEEEEEEDSDSSSSSSSSSSDDDSSEDDSDDADDEDEAEEKTTGAAQATA